MESHSFEFEGRNCLIEVFAADTGYEVRSIIDGRLVPIRYSVTWDDMTYAQYVQVDWEHAVAALMAIAETDIRRKTPRVV